MKMHKFCRCGGSVLTIEQVETDQLCQRCRDEQIRYLPDKKEKKEEA